MNIALRKPMSRKAFPDWADAQDGAWKFGGCASVAMTGTKLGLPRLGITLGVDKLYGGLGVPATA